MFFRNLRYLVKAWLLGATSSCNRTDSKTNIKNVKTGTESAEKSFVLGQQMADAYSAEAKWRQSGVAGQSPLPEKEYDFWRGDLNLIAPAANSLDDEIRHVCKQYSQTDTETRQKIRRSITMDQFYTLIDFAKRSAVFGIRESMPGLVADGLTAIAMVEQERVDFRDILWCFGLLYHAANHVDGNADLIFQDVAILAEPEVSAFLLDFTKQTDEYRDLHSWGYDEIHTANGFGFIGWDSKEYHPTIDLRSAIIDLSILIESDGYQSKRVALATELPGVWLGRQHSTTGKDILSSIVACATISASLRPDRSAEYNSQQFSVFLIEAVSDSDAEKLCKMAENNSSPQHCKLALSRSRLFCLVVARSFVDGVKAYETNASLNRFSDGFAAILDSCVQPKASK